MAYNYPYGNGQQLNLDWFLNEWKNLLAAWEAEKNGIDGALQAEIDRAEAALADVLAARDAAAQSAANALESKNAAAQSASDASGYLATVRADANTASNAAQNAAQSESNAADSAQTALASKSAAGQSERNAAQSEANANSSKNAAAQSASDADASKSAAAQSASDADASKSAAAQSASVAEGAAASVEASAQQIQTNANNIANLNNNILYLNPDAMPYLPINGLISATNMGSLNITRIGNVIKMKGRRDGAYSYLALHDLIGRNLSNYGAETDFINSQEAGTLYFIIKGTITDESTTGDSCGLDICQYKDNPTQINQERLSYILIGETDFKDGIIYKVAIPEHTGPIRMLWYCRFRNYDCEITFKFVSNKELATMQALILENN